MNIHKLAYNIKTKNIIVINFVVLVVFLVFGFSNYANATTGMITFASTPEVLNQNDTATFNFSMSDYTGNSCSGCNYVISTSPQETVSSNKSGNTVTGSFTVHQKGTYSLIVSVTDSSSNTQTVAYPYFVNSSLGNIRYYFRGRYPAHWQWPDPLPAGTGTDFESLLLDPPQVSEFSYCGAWIQFSPDQFPSGFPLSSLLSSFSGHVFLSNHNNIQNDPGYFGLQRSSDYSANVNLSTDILSTPTSTAFNPIFSNINWAMNSSKDWYSFSAKFSTVFPKLLSTPTNPSYADFTYRYTTTPSVGMTNPNDQWNTNIKLLSATVSNSDQNSYSIALGNTGVSSSPTFLTVVNNNRPFINTTSTIDTTGTTKLKAIVPANGNLTINNVPMIISPDSGAIGVSVINWNPSSIDYKQWMEINSSVSAVGVSHTITGLSSNTSYKVRVNNTIYNTYISDSSGSITFFFTDAFYSYNQLEIFPSSSSPDYVTHLKYWYSTGDTSWNTQANWYTDSSHLTPANSLPSSSDVVVLIGSNAPVANLNAWMQPIFIDARVSGVTFAGSGSISSNIIGNVIFSSAGYNYGTLTGNVTFNGTSYNQGIVIGDATFNATSYNYGTLTGNATFNNSSYNYGTVANNATFNDISYNEFSSTVTGNATFNNTSKNKGIVTGNATFNDTSYSHPQSIIMGNAIFSDKSYNLGKVVGTAKFTYATGGIITIPNGGEWGRGGDTATVGNDDNPFTSWVFNGNSSNGKVGQGNNYTNYNPHNLINFIATVNGNATFNDTSYNYGFVTGNATFSDLSYNEGGVQGTAKFTYATDGIITIPKDGRWTNGGDTATVGNDNKSITSWVFNGNGYNNGVVTGDAIFSDTSYNLGEVQGTAKFTYATDGIITIPDGVIWTNGGDTATVGNDNKSITSWIFNGRSANGGTLDGDATFNDTSSNSGTVASNAVFNNASYNTGTVDGDAIFSDTSYNLGEVQGTAKFTYATGGIITIPNEGQWGIGGDTATVGNDNNPFTSWIFNGNSVNNGPVTGDAIFNDTSHNTNGSVSGNATFVGDYSYNEDNSGSIISPIRKYVSGTTTVQDFTVADPPWTVIADGAAVNITGAKYDSGTVFRSMNSGSFSPIITPTISISALSNNSIITSWVPSVSWGTSLTCQYYFDSDIYSSLNCGLNGSDIPAPSYGTHTLNILGTNSSGNSSGFLIPFTFSDPLSVKAITAFTIPNQVGSSTINETNHTISVTMPYGTSLTSLTPTVTILGASVSPQSLVSQNFSSSVTYTVTALDANTQNYTVTVINAPSNLKAITAFTIPNQVGSSTINETNHTISVTMPYGTSLTSLTPTVTILGASVSPQSLVSQNFSSSVTYTVTAIDNTMEAYVVTINNAQNNTTNNTNSSGGGGILTIIPKLTQPTIVAQTPVPPVNTPVVSQIQKLTKNLKLGTISKDVKILQQFLISQNKGPSARVLRKNGATNNFGSLTRKALMEWQKANGLKPDGIFGPKVKAKIKALGL